LFLHGGSNNIKVYNIYLSNLGSVHLTNLSMTVFSLHHFQ
jgi:hypothetical protein